MTVTTSRSPSDTLAATSRNGLQSPARSEWKTLRKSVRLVNGRPIRRSKSGGCRRNLSNAARAVSEKLEGANARRARTASGVAWLSRRYSASSRAGSCIALTRWMRAGVARDSAMLPYKYSAPSSLRTS